MKRRVSLGMVLAAALFLWWLQPSGVLSINAPSGGSAGGCTATAVTPTQIVAGSLSSTDCRSSRRGALYYADQYSFAGSAGQEISVGVTTPSFTYAPYVYLIGPGGAVVAENGSCCASLNPSARIPPGTGFLTLPASGTYIIEVTSTDQNATGNYTLDVVKGPTVTPTPTPTATFTSPPTYTFTPTPTNTFTPTPTKPCGDVNDDGAVNSLDALAVLQYSAGLVTTLPNLPSGDVNNADGVNPIDASLILQVEAGLIPQSSLHCPTHKVGS